MESIEYSKLKKTLIIVDAGHGGIDPNTNQYTTLASIGKKTNHIGYTFHDQGWFYEGVSNRVWANSFVKKATREGYQVAQIYHPYKDTSLAKRVEMENCLFNAYNGNTILLSFHSNAISLNTNPQERTRGFSIHTHNTTGNSYKIAKQIAPAINKTFDLFGAGRDENSLCFARVADITSKTFSNALLLENLFFDNTKDALLLINPIVIESVTETLLQELIKIIP